MLSKFKVTEIYYLIYDFCKESIKIHLNTTFLGNIPRILYYKIYLYTIISVSYLK